MCFYKLSAEIVRKNGFEIDYIDMTVIAQKPKLSPYIEKMRIRIAEVLGVSINWLVGKED